MAGPEGEERDFICKTYPTEDKELKYIKNIYNSIVTIKKKKKKGQKCEQIVPKELKAKNYIKRCWKESLGK